MVSNPQERQRLLDWVGRIGLIGKTLITLGNHDFFKKESYVNEKGKLKSRWTSDFDPDFFKQVNNLENVRVLDNDIYEDENIYVAGVTQPFETYLPREERKPKRKMEKVVYKLSKALFKTMYPVPEDPRPMIKNLRNINLKRLRELPRNKVKLFVTHSPIVLQNPGVLHYTEPFDYVASGHTHNACTPPGLLEIWRSTRGIIAPNHQFFQKNMRNTLRKRKDKILVNGSLVTFPKCTGIMQNFEFLFPSYYSVMEFTNDHQYDTEKVKIKRKYQRLR